MVASQESLILIFADKIYHKLYKHLHIEGSKISIHGCQEASGLSRSCQADLILIDCGFNIQEGLEILQEIKQHRPQIMVILLTDKSSEELAIKAFRLGVREYLPKPVDLFDLQAIINDLIKIRRTSKEIRSAFSQAKNTRQLDAKASSDLPINLLAAIQYIEKNLQEEIDLSRCAKAAMLSKYHFCRHFKRYIGMSPLKYIIQLRVNRAKMLLENKELGISEVGFLAGFSSYNSYIRNFKKLTRLTPKQYRESLT